ncbi:MAG: Pyruvate formate-lyase 1-activating enzyme [Elusimicrobia bacterium ADurb.Bin231]|nr:MAG: Pyruvate formate-lyase 1-activating enzyme [Elusimicrobia bacterium ADurb.Bin231]
MFKKIIFIAFAVIQILCYAYADFQKYNDANPPEHTALYWEKLAGGYIRCLLCPWKCTIAPGQRGMCRTRKNSVGGLTALTYSRPCTINVDPVEKKPFFHFLPGSRAFSIAAAGCNVGCKFCQNWNISKIAPEESDSLYITPEEMVKLAVKSRADMIAYTYTEPTVYYEYMVEISSLARKAGIRSVVVSCGYINREPLKYLLKYVDAYKVDLKAFNEKYYEDIVGARLAPVLETIKTVKDSGVHLEIVYLVVPTLNDNPDEVREMCRWLVKNAGKNVPLHFTRFHPNYKMRDYPNTPVSVVEKLRGIAIEEGINYVYTGNVPPGTAGENTYCPNCKKTIIKRLGFGIEENSIIAGKCRFCGFKISGVFE